MGVCEDQGDEELTMTAHGWAHSESAFSLRGYATGETFSGMDERSAYVMTAASLMDEETVPVLKAVDGSLHILR